MCMRYVSELLVVCVVNSEQKTSSHVQTNLEPAAAGDMTKLAMVQLDSNDAVADDAAKDWLLCVRRRGNVIRKLALVMIGIPLIIVIYFTVSSALSTPHSTQVCLTVN